MIVMMMAMTPSLNASIRPLPMRVLHPLIDDRLDPFIVSWKR